jgi:hypothetical protein
LGGGGVLVVLQTAAVMKMLVNRFLLQVVMAMQG